MPGLAPGRACTANGDHLLMSAHCPCARKLLKNEDAIIYDNPHALILCHYKRDRALCHKDGARDTPSLDHCVPGCGDIARIMRATSVCLA